MVTLQISLELVAFEKIVAYSSPGGQWLPYRGTITDRNRKKQHTEQTRLEQEQVFLMIPSFVFLKKVKTKFLTAASMGKRKISPMCEYYTEVAGP